MSGRTWKIETLLKAVENNIGMAGTLEDLGIRYSQGNADTVRKYIGMLELDVSHWSMKRRDNPVQRKNPSDEEVFCKNSTFARSCVRNRIVKNNLLEQKCYDCNITSWLGKPLTFRLDHINGINNDHRLENLRFLCSNCDSQMETYCIKNVSDAKKKERQQKSITAGTSKKHYNCTTCNKILQEYSPSELCISCYNKNRPKKINWPTIEELEKDLGKMSYLQLGKKLGVSDNAIRGHIKRTKSRLEK